MFSEATSCLATMAAGKMCDAYGMLPGHALQVSDGESAYTQAKLLGPTTWVRLPKGQWLQAWIDAGYEDPVCPLILALYGHPDAGTFWERHCEAKLIEVGFIRVPEWPSVFYHPKHKLFLVVYVDDFKMSGPSESLSIGSIRLSARAARSWRNRPIEDANRRVPARRAWLGVQGRTSCPFSVPESNVSRIPDGRLYAAAPGWHDAANVAWRNAAGVATVFARGSRRIRESKFASHSELG